jgi:hypothetical protein
MQYGCYAIEVTEKGPRISHFAENADNVGQAFRKAAAEHPNCALNIGDTEMITLPCAVAFAVEGKRYVQMFNADEGDEAARDYVLEKVVNFYNLLIAHCAAKRVDCVALITKEGASLSIEGGAMAMF